jgi:hypothetical protein
MAAAVAAVASGGNECIVCVRRLLREFVEVLR